MLTVHTNTCNTCKYTTNHDTYKYYCRYPPMYMPFRALQVNILEYNTDQYVQIPVIHTVHANAYKYTSVGNSTHKYSQVPTNTLEYVQYAPLHANVYQYRSLHKIHTNTSNACK